MAQADELLTYEAAAGEIGIAVGSLKQAIARGVLRPVRVPGQKRKFLRRGDVDRYRDAKRAGTPLPRPGGAPSSAPIRADDDPEPLEMLRLVLATAQATAAATRDTVIAGIDAYLRLKGATPAGGAGPGRTSGSEASRQEPESAAEERFARLLCDVLERAAEPGEVDREGMRDVARRVAGGWPGPSTADRADD